MRRELNKYSMEPLNQNDPGLLFCVTVFHKICERLGDLGRLKYWQWKKKNTSLVRIYCNDFTQTNYVKYTNNYVMCYQSLVMLSP